ncbi:MAG: HAD family hydrolase [Candidatus Nanoarchaeia archaeon]|jgi:phosphoglycolate phosphatase-like HAD superfamily hydrolase
MNNLYVFDFHGVLEKGTEKAVAIVSNLALKRLGYDFTLSHEEIMKHYGHKWHDIFLKTIPQLSSAEAYSLYEECLKVDELFPSIILENTKQNDNAKKAIEKIMHNNDQFILISNTNPNALKTFIKAAGLSEFFSESNSFAVNQHDKGASLTKENVLRAYLNGKSYEKIIIIGDSPGDIELKKVNPNNSVTFLYTHPGLNFRDCEADHKIRDLMEIFLN